MATGSGRSFVQRLRLYYGVYTLGFIGFVVLLGLLEQAGLKREWIGYIFMFVTVALYAGIGIMSRTTDVAEYFVAGRRVPAFFNGMATAADWMSAASFIGLAGTLYLAGFDGLAYIVGWTGGFCLVAFFLAPYLRKFGQYTIPDFLGTRYGCNYVRGIGVLAAILCSFVYVVAQIYGVGLITSRMAGLDFTVGVFVGLAGILVCSFLGGMRAITWTQVAQYIILIVAYMIPVVWLSMKHTHVPIPQLVYGTVLEKVTDREKVLNDVSTVDGMREAEVRGIFALRAEELEKRVNALPESWARGRDLAERQLAGLREANAPKTEVRAAEKALLDFPKTPEAAQATWQSAQKANQARAAPVAPHAVPYPAASREASDVKRNNFLALALCLMVGTAALPHILMRYYTTPSVHEARQSVFWSLFFITLLYVTAPALAVLVKFDIYGSLVGSKFDDLPNWAAAWSKVDPTLLSIVDVNKDGIIQLAEISLGADVVMLATPEIAGLPYVVTGLVAAGGLAAALSTADGLLLTISNALSHDVYYKMVDPSASTTRRIAISKFLLLGAALVAAFVAAAKPGNILFMVGAAFSLAASAFFPALVLGIFWKRANRQGAIAGMLGGFAVCLYYMGTRYEYFQKLFGFNMQSHPLWLGINPISSGAFGLPAGFALLVVVSLLTPPPHQKTRDFIEHVRYPRIRSS
jgi:cation/acetate symporter